MTLSNQKQVGKTVQIGVTWARKDGLRRREGRVEDVEFRVAL